MKRIPYGISDFDTVIKDDMYYVDKTRFIQTLEERGRFILLLRPRRMGKSLFTNMLMSYYDINKQDEFDTLFGKLWIGQHKTALANTHLVLKLDFSMVDCNKDDLRENFTYYCRSRISSFLDQYQNLIPKHEAEEVLRMETVKVMVDKLIYYVHNHKLRIYLFIDEYDNFTNTVLSARGVEAHREITHGEGFYRDFFKCCKGTFDRIYMTGVTPVTYDDLSSGFGIADIISLVPMFHQMVGVSEDELRTMIEYYRGEGRIKRGTEEIIAEMKPWYDSFCFAERCFGKEPTMFNTNMVMRYMREILSYDETPDVMIDNSARTDTNKLDYLIMSEDIGHRETRIQTVREICATGQTTGEIVEQFPASEAGSQENFKSMLYYFGTLTYAGRNRYGKTILRIPNKTMGELYLGYMLRVANGEGLDFGDERRNELDEAVSQAALDGEWQAMADFIGRMYKDYSGIRNAIRGEHDIQGFVRGLLCINQYFDLWPELELNKGYCDVLLIPQPTERCYTRHSFVIEIKYMKAGETNTQAYIDEAKRQLEQYMQDIHIETLLRGTDLTRLYMVFQGQEMVACDRI